ncbi:MAG: 1-acyl-sn-glycerol-3-phosphate acyltransferase [Candidatus Hydrogenedentes bacterium]|nr:1-acyl-sn-glycerol-3-phosphate acyltransferase [Candidatus Hydrogenedentota bacterium]
MKLLRIGVRLPLLLASVLGVFLLWTICRPVGLVTPLGLRRIRRWLLQGWGWTCLRIVNARVECSGAAPKPPFYLVANHLSYVDIFLLARYAGPVFVARSEMAEWPLFGFMLRQSQMLFIRRGQLRDAPRVLDLLQAQLDAGDGIVIFPEARCTRGVTVQPFKPALLEAAARRSFPVSYATLSYATPEGEPAAGDSVVWWRWEGVHSHLFRLLALPGFTARIDFGPVPVISNDRKVLATTLHQVVLRNFVPIEQGVLEELPMPETAPAALFREDAQVLPAKAQSLE